MTTHPCENCRQLTSNPRFCSVRCACMAANANREGQPLADRFWSRVDHGEPDACWPWKGARDVRGYGVLTVGSKRDGTNRRERAHRIAWSVANGEAQIPDGLHIRHRCDNPPCCNPAHLLTGTPAENVQDKVERDRAPRAERHYGAKLTEALVRQLRAECRTRGDIAAFARKHGIPAPTLYDAFRGTTWRQVS